MKWLEYTSKPFTIKSCTGVGSHFPSPGDLSNPGIQPMTLVSPALAGGFFTTGATWKAMNAAKYPAVTRTASPQYELFNSKYQ